MAVAVSPTDRALLLHWLANLFAEEQSESTLSYLVSDEGQKTLEAIGDLPGLAEHTSALKTALSATIGDTGNAADITRATRLLAARYATLFLGVSGPDSAHPYASVYLEGRLRGEAEQRTQDFLKQHGLAVTTNVNHPDDHIAIQLNALAILAEREAELAQEENTAEETVLFDTQASFARTEIKPWLPDFLKRIERDDSNGFYAAAGRLTNALLDELY